MTDAQMLALLGGATQVSALVWAWAVLYARWRRENPGEHVFPGTVRLLRAIGGAARSVWEWLTQPVRKPQRVGAGATAYTTVNVISDAHVQSHGTVEERLDSLDARFQESERHTTAEFRKVREEMAVKTAEVVDEHRRDREADRANAKYTVRFNLGYPAFLAIIGIVLQTWAAFASDN